MSKQRGLYFDDETTRVLVQKLDGRIKEIFGHIYRESAALPSFKIKQGEVAGGEGVDLDDSGWEEFRIPGTWGAYLANFWFRTRFEIPEEFKGKRVCVYLHMSSRGGLRGAEGLLYLDGKARERVAINGPEVFLEEKAKPGREYVLAVEVYSGLTHEKHDFRRADLVVVDEAASDFYYSALVTLDAARSLAPSDVMRARLLAALDGAIGMVDFREPGSSGFYASIERANEYLTKQIDDAGEGGERATVTCVGHAHLDVVWLWVLSQTRRKAARTFTNSLRAMERYPKYHFLASQAQLYDLVKRHYPAVHEEVKKRVADGRWEAPGGMWVEPDCNLTGGESLVRQFIFGIRSGQRADVVPGQLRVLRVAASDCGQVRDEVFHDDEDKLERYEPVPL